MPKLPKKVAKGCDLGSGASIDTKVCTNNQYYVGGAVRFGGCDTSNTYLGYIDFSVNGNNITFGHYTPPTGVHIALQNPTVTGNAIKGSIAYTAIQPNFTLPSPALLKNSPWQFAGINLSGLEFGKMIDPVVVPNVSVQDQASDYSDLKEVTAFINSGMNIVRVPISWGFIQLDGPGKGDLNANYIDSYLKPLLESLTKAHMYAMVDLHAYMRYSKFGTQFSGCTNDPNVPCPDGTMILDAAAYQDVWSKIYDSLSSDKNIDMNYVLFDLVNEPVGIPGDTVFTVQAAVIKTLRNKGFNGYILVEGNFWTGLHSWNQPATDKDGKVIAPSNAELFSRDNFAKAGITDLSKILINVHQYLDSDYSGTHDVCITDLTTTGKDGYNLNAFVDYLKQNQLKAIVTEFGAGKDQTTCKQALAGFLDYLKNNAATPEKNYGFVGWTIWSAGHGWGDYNLRVKPESYQMDVIQNYLRK